jgi:hypothetical protein
MLAGGPAYRQATGTRQRTLDSLPAAFDNPFHSAKHVEIDELLIEKRLHGGVPPSSCGTYLMISHLANQGQPSIEHTKKSVNRSIVRFVGKEVSSRSTLIMTVDITLGGAPRNPKGEHSLPLAHSARPSAHIMSLCGQRELFSLRA